MLIPNIQCVWAMEFLELSAYLSCISSRFSVMVKTNSIFISYLWDLVKVPELNPGTLAIFQTGACLSSIWYVLNCRIDGIVSICIFLLL